MNPSVLDTILTFLVRRGLTMLGTTGAAVSDDWITTTVGLVIVALNELWQARKAHQVKKAIANG